MGRRTEDSDDRPAPKLKSLAQAARGNQLKQIRNTLLTIGIITIIFNIIDMVMVPGQVRAELAKQGPALNAPGMPNAEAMIYAIAFTLDGLGLALGVLFVVFGLLVSRFPVPITIASLVVYILATITCVPIMLFSVGAGSLMAIIFRIVFIIALVKAVQTAFAYERERRAELALADGEFDEADDE